MSLKGLSSQRYQVRRLGYKEETQLIPALKAQVGKEDEQRVLAHGTWLS